MKELNLIRKIAWSFSKSCGIDYAELFQEACLSYFEALRSYDSTKAKQSTYLWHSISNRLKNYVKKEKEFSENVCPITKDDDEMVFDYGVFESLSSDALEVLELAKILPGSHLRRKAIARQTLKQLLLWDGWSYKKINNVFHEIELRFL